MFQPYRRKVLIAAAAATAMPAFGNEQPIRITVGFPPGGTTDVLGRLVANGLGKVCTNPGQVCLPVGE